MTQAAKVAGVASVLVAKHAAYDHAPAENVSALLVHLQSKQQFSHFVSAASAAGKSILPRAAVALDSAPITDVVCEDHRYMFV
jgi:electron transfer flavoprotein alpha subunit